MKASKILDMPEATIEGLEIETCIIESIARNCRALIICARTHANKRDAAEKNAEAALNEGDHESYHRWLDIFFREDNSYNLLHSALNEYGVSDDLIIKEIPSQHAHAE